MGSFYYENRVRRTCDSEEFHRELISHCHRHLYSRECHECWSTTISSLPRKNYFGYLFLRFAVNYSIKKNYFMIENQSSRWRDVDKNSLTIFQPSLQMLTSRKEKGRLRRPNRNLMLNLRTRNHPMSFGRNLKKKFRINFRCDKDFNKFTMLCKCKFQRRMSLGKLLHSLFHFRYERFLIIS